jgi:membrane protein YdbS with pleckstrin-like domain
MTDTMANSNSTPPAQRQFAVARDDLGTVRIVNDTTKHTIAALTRREAKQLSRELRRVLKNGSKS